jgi:hypothetical protein
MRRSAFSIQQPQSHAAFGQREGKNAGHLNAAGNAFHMLQQKVFQELFI